MTGAVAGQTAHAVHVQQTSRHAGTNSRCHPPQHALQQGLRQHGAASAAVIQEEDAGSGGLAALAGSLCRVWSRPEDWHHR